MTDSKSRLEPPRKLVKAMLRGFVGKCPNCGSGRLLRGYMTPVPVCSACSEDLAPFQTADFASYAVMFLVGAIFTPVALVLSMSAAPTWLAVLVMILAIASIFLLMPRAKGAAISLLWALNVRGN